jgi:hypothetical protein
MQARRIHRKIERKPPNWRRPAMTQEEHRRGSAAVALRRLSHPGRDGRDAGAVAGDDQLSEVARRLLELLAVVGHRTAEDRIAAPRPTERAAPVAPVPAVDAPRDDDTGTATINLRFDTQMLARVDTAAKRLGISRTAWLHLAAEELLDDRR